MATATVTSLSSGVSTWTYRMEPMEAAQGQSDVVGNLSNISQRVKGEAEIWMEGAADVRYYGNVAFSQ